jgi:predicted phage terminase large subunit-like protein
MSYGQQLSTRDSVKRRRIIESPWYKRFWGDRYHITSDQNQKTRYENDYTGYMIATSLGGLGTGEGGDRVIIDDAHNVNEVESDLKRETAINTWDDTMGTRVDDEDTGAYIGIMQRTHKKDLTGHLLEKVKTKQIKHFVHLCLPARYEKDHPCPTRTPLRFKDPRKREGEALDQNRWPVSKLDIREGRMTKWAISGQHQQRPNIRGGELIPVGQIKVVDSYNDRHIVKMVRYWDKAISLDKSASSTASVLMAFMSDECAFGVIILDCIVGKWGAGIREQKIKQTAQLDGVAVRVGVEQEPGSGGKESAENTMKKTLVGFDCFADHPTGAKEVRLDPFIAQVEHGNVAVLNRTWTKGYLDALEDCSIGSVLDEGDATSGAFNELSGLGGEKKKAKVRVYVG